MKRLDRKARRSLREQLRDILISEIRKCSIGDRFHSERELCRNYGVSLPVVRAALGDLAAQGYIRRETSRGTFVESLAPDTSNAQRRVIGLFTPMDGYCPHVAAVRAIETMCRANGYDLLLHGNQQSGGLLDPARMASMVIEDLSKVSGVIWIGSILESIAAWPASLTPYAQRLMFLNVYAEHGNVVSSVLRDDVQTSMMLTSHLLDCGCADVGFLGGDPERPSVDHRFEGYRRALTQRGKVVDDSIIAMGSVGITEETGKEAVRELSRRGHIPAGLVCATDRMARGAIEALQDLGLSVPGDIRLGGFDNAPESVQGGCPLTTMDSGFFELGQAAASLLIDQVERGLAPGMTSRIVGKLVMRESSGCLENNPKA